tara:strand:+ start:121 stop:1023 length:903 start_codon:yes stop_codon:yes gene_type:complete
MRTIIQNIIINLWVIPIYFFINIRRYINEKKIKQISNNELLKNGFIKFNSDNGTKLAEYLKNVVENPEDAENSNLGKFKIFSRSSLGVKSIAVDSSSEFLHKYVFTEEILKKLENFYGKSFYLRNNPTLEFDYDNEKNDSQYFHLDWGLKQTSVMINLNDVLKNSTHMEYIKGSNRQYKFRPPSRFNKREIQNIEYKHKNLETVKTTGDIGQISIFDAGCGYHRQVAGGRRVMLHLNFTENLVFTYWKKNWQPSDTAYWFSDNSENLKLKDKLFDLVKRRFNSSFFTPHIYKKLMTRKVH